MYTFVALLALVGTALAGGYGSEGGSLAEVQPPPPAAQVQQTSPVAEDQHEMCCGWALLGECDSNAFWMRPNCQQSCGTPGCSVDDAGNCAVSVDTRGCPWTLEFLENYKAEQEQTQQQQAEPVVDLPPVPPPQPEPTDPEVEAPEEIVMVSPEQEVAQEVDEGYGEVPVPQETIVEEIQEPVIEEIQEPVLVEEIQEPVIEEVVEPVPVDSYGSEPVVSEPAVEEDPEPIVEVTEPVVEVQEPVIDEPAPVVQEEPAVSGDNHEYCCFWAATGECETNAYWMRVQCQDSCGTPGCTVDNAESCELNVDTSACPEYAAAPAPAQEQPPVQPPVVEEEISEPMPEVESSGYRRFARRH